MKQYVSLWTRLMAVIAIVASSLIAASSASAGEPVTIEDPASYTFQEVDVTLDISDDSIEITEGSFNEFGTKGTEEYISFSGKGAIGQVGVITNMGSLKKYEQATRGNIEDSFDDVEIVDEETDGSYTWVAGTGEYQGETINWYYQIGQGEIEGEDIFEYVAAFEGELAPSIDLFQDEVTIGTRGFMENVKSADLEELFGTSTGDKKDDKATKEADSTPASSSTSRSSKNSKSSKSTTKNADDATPTSSNASKKSSATPSAESTGSGESGMADDTTFIAGKYGIELTWGPEYTVQKDMTTVDDKTGHYSLKGTIGETLIIIDIDEDWRNGTAEDYVEGWSDPDVVTFIDKEAELLDTRVDGDSGGVLVSEKGFDGTPQITYRQVFYVDENKTVGFTFMGPAHEFPAALDTVSESFTINGKPAKMVYTGDEVEKIINK